jgi:hypothetical protein
VLALLYVVLAAPPCPAGTWCNENGDGLVYDAIWIDGNGTNDVWAWNNSDTLAHWDGKSWSPIAAPEGTVVADFTPKGPLLLARPKGGGAGHESAAPLERKRVGAARLHRRAVLGCVRGR